MAATLQVAGRRAHKLSSSYPRPGRSHAEPCRSRRPSLHATSCYGESFASSTVARSSSTLLRRFERPFWLDVERRALRSPRGSALKTVARYTYLASSRPALAIRAFALMISITCSRSACRISRTKGHRTQHHRHVAKIPVCLPGGYLLLRALSPVATSPMVLVHEFAYYIMSQSTGSGLSQSLTS